MNHRVIPGYLLTTLLLCGALVCLGCQDDAPTDDPQGGTDGQSDGVLADVVGAVSEARYEADLITIAKPRPPGSGQWQAVQDLCANRLEELGYQVSRQRYATGVNVIGRRVGAKEAHKQVILSAHYDHLDGCAGADDNASGVAGLLESARVLALATHDRTLVVACWDEEERHTDPEEWLLGSTAYVSQAKADAEQIVVSYVYEMIGYASDAPNSQAIPPGFDALFPAEVARIKANDSRADFIALVFDQHATNNSQAAVDEIERVGATVDLPTVALPVLGFLKSDPRLGDLRRSDHDPFWQQDYPALMITDTANFRNPNYHCPDGRQDTVDTLDHGFATKVVKATVGAVVRSLRASE